MSAIGFSQEPAMVSPNIVEEYTFRTKIYGKEDGYSIKSYQSSIVDDYGTLWVAGTTEAASVNQLNKEFVGLYFFNGTKFQEFPFHDSLKMASGIKLLPGHDGNFIVLLGHRNGATLMSVNPFDLTYTEIQQTELPKEKTNYVKSYVFNDEVYIVYNYGAKSFISKLKNDKKLEAVSEFTIENTDQAYFENIVTFKTHILLHDKHSGVYLLNAETNNLRKVFAQDLGTELSTEPKIKIEQYFHFQDTSFFQFNLSEHFFYYNESSNSWVKTHANRFPFQKVDVNGVFNEESELLIFNSKKQKGDYYLEVYLKKEQKLTTTIPLGELTSKPKINSRHYQKEVFVFSQNKLVQISFQRLKIKSFLKKYSIRSMLELPNNKVLVGTEFNGLWEINLETGEEKMFSSLLDGKPFMPGHIRGIVQDSNGIYCNYPSGICFMDKYTNETTLYRYFPVARLRGKGTSLYYATNGHKLMRFDKKLRINIPLAITPDLDMQDFVFAGDTIYIATLTGLYIYTDSKQELISAPENSNQLLCLAKHPTLGLLTGTTDGKVLIYNPISKKFTELYSDKFNASIATLLVDNQNNVWINSFKGFIKYNLKDKSTSRFGVKEGFSDNEANRFAALNLKNSNLLVGTIKGVNYFNPIELTETKIDARLKFTEIGFIDSDKKQKLINSPKELNALTEIILQPQNRNVSISFGFNDIIGIQDNLKFKYRLNNGSWRIVNEFGELFLGNLAPDTYELEISAINQIEAEIGKPITLTIIAKAFFYKTSWFWILIGLLATLIVSWIAYEYISKQRIKQRFADKIISAHIEEQASLSQKLHDSVGQKLLLAKNDFILNKKVPKEELSNLDEIISEVRNISHDLHPLQFETLGFKASVENLIENFQRNSETFYSHEIMCKDAILPLEKEIILFGIIQECLNNVEKHSQAEACRVQVYETKKELIVEVKDNGKGFDITKKSVDFSLGLKTMKEKAGYLNAKMIFISSPNEGTSARLSIKLTT